MVVGGNRGACRFKLSHYQNLWNIDKNIWVTLEERLKKARKGQGIAQAKLAALAGTSQQTIQQLESRRSKRSGKLPEIAAVLGVSPMWLLTGEGGAMETTVGDPIFTVKTPDEIEWLQIYRKLSIKQRESLRELLAPLILQDR